ncbi:NitT/TauT family transport system ATP-binding protein [Marinobacter persicus]|uniref:NitT/TauT family transport system ATP-binding protein n=1 Tax=Marinobacter persicus TaxID=930118 RepID=A0A1I3V2L8_9GAMM|nr:ABC transporter ATP-binding protein [Marinobacter persicus]GHD41938.1 lauroyl acyltransferase [Marinobacter persicus]SFJ88381.1 NitT/TauT family transport system ATP-binding protein [Marinobacter persicus]
MSFISVNKLWKEYGDQVVLENLNLEVEQGEFCTLVGASGCGKSTFLKMLLGQESQSRGELLLEGETFPAEPDRNRGIVFQRYSVFPHLTVRQNVLMGLELEQKPVLGKLFGSARSEALKKVDDMLELVGLGPSANKWPHELSGGMQQRLAIAQSLIMRPRVLLLDEPFGALDPGIRKDMHELLLQLWREIGITIFMVTHDLHEGFYLGTRLLVFDKLRNDPHAPNAFGATITYDLPIGQTDERLLRDIDQSVTNTARYQAA